MPRITVNRFDRPVNATCLFCQKEVTDGRDASGYAGLGTDWMTEDCDFGCRGNPIANGGHWTLYDATGLYLAVALEASRA